MQKLFIVPVLFLLASASASAAAPSASPEGYWRTPDGNGIIEILQCGAGDTLCGKLAWLRITPNDPSPQGLDINNPDPALRNRPVCGLTFMYGFKPDGTGHWDGGRVYDIQSGKTYNVMITLRPDGKLDLHGYIGISLLGRSEIWTRFNEPIPTCPGH